MTSYLVNRKMRGGKRKGEVVASGGTVEIEDFAGEIESGIALGSHGVRVDFGEVDAAEGDDGFLERAGAGIAEGEGAPGEGDAQGRGGEFGKGD